MKIQIIQVPYDSGYRDLRQGCGPAHFIDQNLAGVLEADGHQILTSRIDAKSKFTTEIGTAFELNRLLSGEVNAAVGSGLFPLVLAGNCNSCLGTIAGIDPVKLGVVWFDAHGEFNTPETTRSGFLDGMPLAMATGRCWKAILETIPGFIPVEESNVILIGARDLDPEEKRQLQLSRVNVIGSAGINADKLLDQVEAALNKLQDQVSGIYLHIDMDALAINEGAANHFGANGGLKPEFIEAAIAMVRQNFSLKAGTVASFDPTFDSKNRFLEAGIRCIRQMVSVLEG
jgi:arginase